MKTEIKNVKITKLGDSCYVRIPSDFIKHGDIDAEKEYNIELEEINEV